MPKKKNQSGGKTTSASAKTAKNAKKKSTKAPSTSRHDSAVLWPKKELNVTRPRKRQQRKVGREEEGSSSNRPELAAFVLALRGTSVTKPMLYLCDNQALLEAVKRWVGEGGKATLVGAPDADLLLEAIEEF